MKRPLSLNEAVYATKLASNGQPFIERGFVTRLHDDYIEMLSVDSGGTLWVKRENIVTLEKMKELEAK